MKLKAVGLFKMYKLLLPPDIKGLIKLHSEDLGIFLVVSPATTKVDIRVKIYLVKTDKIKFFTAFQNYLAIGKNKLF